MTGHRNRAGRALAAALLVAGTLVGAGGTVGVPVAAAAGSEAVYVPNGPSGTVYRLYRAYFLREPDAGGFDYWNQAYANGHPLPAISDDFARSREFVSRYGEVDPQRFVQLVYENVLERSPDSGGYAYWTERMAAGMPRGHVMIHFSDSPEFRSKTRNGAPPGTTITMWHTSEITPAQLSTIEHAVITGRAALRDGSPLVLYVSSDHDAFAADYARIFGTSVEDARRTLAGNSIGGTSRDQRTGAIVLDGATIFQTYGSHKTAWVTSAHEAVHTVQALRARLMGPPDADGISDWGPAWIAEGHADLLGWRLAVESGSHPVFADWSSLRAGAVVPFARQLTGSLSLISPQHSSNEYGVDQFYAKSTLAAELLRSYAGADAMDRTYWQELAGGSEWRAAFEAAFGMSVETFIQRFDAWAAAGYPPIR